MINLKGLSPSENSDLYYKEHTCLVYLLNEITSKLDADTSKKTFEDVIEKTLYFFDVKQIKTMYPAYLQGTLFNDTVKKLTTLIWNEFEMCTDWMRAIENFLGLNSIPIMTIHKSKGLEYNSVYFIGLEDDAFWSFKYQPEEDRCAFFVALSRAKEHLSFSYCSYRHKLWNPTQKHDDINEFFELLQAPGISTVITCK